MDLKQVEAVAATKELITSAQEDGVDPAGLQLMGIGCDVASEESVVCAFEQVGTKFGRVDAVVASAGAFHPCPLVSMDSLFKGIVENHSALEYVRRFSYFLTGAPTHGGRYPLDRARKLFDINVHGAYLTAREAAKIMIPNGGGSIILIASMSASVSTINFLN